MEDDVVANFRMCAAAWARGGGIRAIPIVVNLGHSLVLPCTPAVVKNEKFGLSDKALFLIKHPGDVIKKHLVPLEIQYVFSRSFKGVGPWVFSAPPL